MGILLGRSFTWCPVLQPRCFLGMTALSIPHRFPLRNHWFSSWENLKQFSMKWLILEWKTVLFIPIFFSDFALIDLMNFDSGDWLESNWKHASWMMHVPSPPVRLFRRWWWWVFLIVFAHGASGLLQPLSFRTNLDHWIWHSTCQTTYEFPYPWRYHSSLW